jgi:hypothetical protein
MIKSNYPVFLRTRDLSHLNYWQQRLWWLWFQFSIFCAWAGLPSQVAPDGTRIVLQAVASTEAVAKAICLQLGPDAFYKAAPVDASLPVGEVIFGGNQMPSNNNSQLLHDIGKREIPVVCPWTHEKCKPHDTVNRIDLEKLYRRIKTVAAS